MESPRIYCLIRDLMSMKACYKRFVPPFVSKNADRQPITAKGTDSQSETKGTVKDMLRAALLHRRLAQTQWRKILPRLVFALNTSISKPTNCVPYNVVFGRTATLPQDIVFGDFQPDQFDYLSVNDYQQELPITLSDIYKHVIETLEISKRKMQQHYNKHLRFHDYEEGQKVWLKAKHYKTGNPES